jgi:ADP-ribose pyrophosphatase YjhB (NUDIX family)
MKEKEITIKALCIFHKDGKILVSKHFDKAKNESFYRLLGGSVNFSETSETGIRREIQEELLSDVENLELIKIIENIFIYEGKKGHEISFLYKGDLVRKELYSQNPIHVIEETYEFDAEWIDLNDILTEKIPLYPIFDYKTFLETKKS